MLFQAGEHSEIALIHYRTAESLNVASASAQLPLILTALPRGGTRKENRQAIST